MPGYRTKNLHAKRLPHITGTQRVQARYKTTWLRHGHLALAICLSAMGLTVAVPEAGATTRTHFSSLGEPSEAAALDATLDKLADGSELPNLDGESPSSPESSAEDPQPEEPIEDGSALDVPDADAPDADTSDADTPDADTAEAEAAEINEILPQVDIEPSPRSPIFNGLENARPVRGDDGYLETAFDQYRLGPGDGIFVSVQRFPDLSFQATLDLQGNIILPIQGDIKLEGYSLEQAEFLISCAYEQYVDIREVDFRPSCQPLSPQAYSSIGPADVALTLTAQRGVEVTILGEVERPGFYPLPEPRVSTALLIAGGASSSADLRSLQVQRRLRSGEVISETVDLFTPLREGQALPDLRLENGDVITIPRLDPATLDGYDRHLISRSTLAQPQITIRVLNYAAGGRGTAGNLGALNVENGSSFIDAITQMGINPDRARLGSVALVRFDPETGEAVSLELDAKDAFRGDPTQNPPLQDNDVIIVGRNFISRLSFALDTVTRPFRDVLGFLLFVDGVFDTNVFD